MLCPLVLIRCNVAYKDNVAGRYTQRPWRPREVPPQTTPYLMGLGLSWDLALHVILLQLLAVKGPTNGVNCWLEAFEWLHRDSLGMLCQLNGWSISSIFGMQKQTPFLMFHVCFLAQAWKRNAISCVAGSIRANETILSMIVNSLLTTIIIKYPKSRRLSYWGIFCFPNPMMLFKEKQSF